MEYKHCDYLVEALRPTERTIAINKAVKRLRYLQKHKRLDFEAIAFCGASGSLLAPSIADRLDKDLIFIRKNLKNTHSIYKCEGCNDAYLKYIIIDDLISSEKTITRIMRAVKKFMIQPKCQGIYLYSSQTWHMTRDKIEKIAPLLNARKNTYTGY